jgi:NAD(P)-dependent dehydrogenase (short-subunit alcohol dehydrogenase family)
MAPSNPTSKVVLITGTSSGFGLLTAVHLSSKGHHVYATMRDLRKKDFLLSEVKKAGGKVTVLPLDVTHQQSIVNVAREIASDHGHLDVLVNNAGFGVGGFFEDLTEEEIRQQMDVNFFGVQNVTRQAIPLMRSRRKGTIINISSIAGLNANPPFGAYNASKFALEGFSESLFHEMKLFGINVCLIEPGTYKTKIFFDNARYAKNFDNPDSPYYSMSQHLKKTVLDYVKKTDKDPRRIAFLVEKLMNQPQPPFRSLPDVESKLLILMKRVLPFRLYAATIEKYLFQDRII